MVTSPTRVLHHLTEKASGVRPQLASSSTIGDPEKALASYSSLVMHSSLLVHFACSNASALWLFVDASAQLCCDDTKRF